MHLAEEKWKRMLHQPVHVSASTNCENREKFVSCKGAAQRKAEFAAALNK